jgi:2-dehydropantoate 2-reductase
MRIAVVGAGGLGSKFAACLAEHAEVVVMHRRPEWVDAVNAHGLRMTRGDHDTYARVTATADPAGLSRAEVVLIAVKSYDSAAVADQLAGSLDDDAVVLTLQNGLGNVEALGERLGAHRVGLAVTTEGATSAGLGHVEDKGRGLTHVGMPRSAGATGAKDASTVLAPFVELLNDSGLRAELTPEIEGYLWAKLAMASGINPVAVAVRVRNGDLARFPEVRDLSESAIREVVALAEAKGVTLAFDPLEAFDRVTAATAAMTSGSLIDSLRGRRTELGSICGAVAAEAAAVGVAAPVSSMLYRLSMALEASVEVRVEPHEVATSVAADNGSRRLRDVR